MNELTVRPQEAVWTLTARDGKLLAVRLLFPLEPRKWREISNLRNGSWALVPMEIAG